MDKISFDNENINYVTPIWDDMNECAFSICKNMIADGLEIDRIVTLAKGGWPMTRSLVDFLQVKKVASIGVSFYSGINKRMEEPKIYQDIPVSVKGENILLFDDVADTGGSLMFVKDYLKNLGVKSLTTATLFYKPHSQIKPDYYGEETDAWIIFPYDSVESIIVLGEKWQENGVDKKEIKQRFGKMGIKKEWIKYYLK